MPDRLEGSLKKREFQRMMSLVEKGTSAILAALSESVCPLTVTEIAQRLGRPLTPRFITLVESLVMCRYLTRDNTASGVVFDIKRHKPGNLPEPRLPLPFYLYESCIDEDRLN